MCNLEDAIALAYVTGLSRAPDAGGFKYWLNTATQNGWNEQQLMANLCILMMLEMS